jgi:TonB family protein
MNRCGRAFPWDRSGVIAQLAIIGALASSRVHAAPGAEDSHWRILQSRPNTTTDSTIVAIGLDAEGAFAKRARLTCVCSDGIPALFLVTDGSLTDLQPIGSDWIVEIRFDDSEPTRQRWANYPNPDTWQAPDPVDLMKQMATSNTMHVGLVGPDSLAAVLQFKVNGPQSPLQTLVSGCENRGEERIVIGDMELPRVVSKVSPVYPKPAIRAGLQGTVVVQALIGADGRVRETRIAKSVPGLDDAAEKCVRKWKFMPGTNMGRMANVWVAVPIKFSLP